MNLDDLYSSDFFYVGYENDIIGLLVDCYSVREQLHIMDCVQYDLKSVKDFSSLVFEFEEIDKDCIFGCSIHISSTDKGFKKMIKGVSDIRLRNYVISNTVEHIKFILSKFVYKNGKDDLDWLCDNIVWTIKWHGNVD